MEARGGDKEASARYIQAEAQLAQQFPKEIVPAAFDKFLANKEQRATLNKTVEDQTTRLADDVRRRAAPLLSLMVESVDEWINQAKKKGAHCETKRFESRPFASEEPKYSTVYEVTFKSGARLRLFMRAAVIRSGVWVGEFGLSPQYTAVNQPEIEQFNVGFNNEIYFLSAGSQQSYFTVKGRTKPLDASPADNEAFNATVREAINQVMGHVIGDNSDL